MKIPRVLFAILACSIFICSCDSKLERERNKWRETFQNISNSYFATDLSEKKQEALNRSLALLDEADGKRLFPNSPDFLDGNRAIIYLRLCAVAYRHDDNLRANIYREKAAFCAARINLEMLGGIDLANPSNLSVIVDGIEAVDRELRKQKDGARKQLVGH